jgi:hypothetical protein
MTTRWVCVFEGRAGGHARAVFGTSDQAQQFAERHARATAPGGVPLTWQHTSDASVLTTALGIYLVSPTDDE